MARIFLNYFFLLEFFLRAQKIDEPEHLYANMCWPKQVLEKRSIISLDF